MTPKSTIIMQTAHKEPIRDYSWSCSAAILQDAQFSITHHSSNRCLTAPQHFHCPSCVCTRPTTCKNIINGISAPSVLIWHFHFSWLSQSEWTKKDNSTSEPHIPGRWGKDSQRNKGATTFKVQYHFVSENTAYGSIQCDLQYRICQWALSFVNNFSLMKFWLHRMLHF